MEENKEETPDKEPTELGKKNKLGDSLDNAEITWEEDFEWKSLGQHITYFLIYVSEWNTFVCLIYEDPEENPAYDVTIIHYFILMILVGCPLIFMQTFIGQYTRRGPFVIGEMMPVAYGFGYTITSIALADFILQYYYTVYFLFYFFVALNNSYAPWVLCTDQFYAAFPHCFSYEDIDWCPTVDESAEPCFSAEDKILPGSIYMHYVGLIKLKGSKEIADMYPSAGKKLFFLGLHAAVLLTIMVAITGRSVRNFEVIMRFSVACIFACLLSMLVIIFTQSGGLLGLKKMIHATTFQALLNFPTWSSAFRRLVAVLKLSQGGHILFGSFIPVNDLSPYRAVYLSFSFFFAVFCFYIYYFFFYGLFLFKLNLTMTELHLDSEQGIIFVFFPYLLGVQAFGRFFCVVYFAVLLLVNLCSLNIKLLVLERIISNHFKINSHFIYIKYGIIGAANIFALILMVPVVTENLSVILHEYYIFIVASLFLQLCIVLLYGIQRFCDDVQFFLHVKVANFVKICWIVVPFLCIVEIIGDAFFQRDQTFAVAGIRLVVFAFCYVPVLVSLIRIIFLFAKNKNLIGLLKPMDTYGPPDIIQRIFRILYNPRLTVKYKMQLEPCSHGCLLLSPGLEKAIEEEILLIQKLAKALEANMSRSKIYREVSERLKLHCELLKDKRFEKVDKIYSALKVPILQGYDTTRN